MKYVDQNFFTTYEIKKSKFISHLIPYKNFDKTLCDLKKQHPKARHFVYALRYLNEFDQIVENSSDDGEPKGTSGKPTLAVLAGADMINCAIITVRYFGGIKLGTGGLVKAYSNSANLVINDPLTIIKSYQKLKRFTIKCKYNHLRELEYYIKKLNINIVDKSYQDDITFILETTQDSYDKLSSFVV